MTRSVCAILGLAFLPGCTSSSPPTTDRPPARLRDAAMRFYDAYTQDLRAQNRQKLATYYHPAGAVVVIGGRRMTFTHAGIDSLYRGAWQGPTAFAWDNLSFDSLGPEFVVVTGGFRWLAAGAKDTTRYIYVSVLQAVDSGLGIRLEHETPIPPPARR